MARGGTQLQLDQGWMVRQWRHQLGRLRTKRHGPRLLLHAAKVIKHVTPLKRRAVNM